MTILVSDTAVINDLQRGDFLEAAFGLDETFVATDVFVRHDLDTELRDRLISLGLQVETLGENEVRSATTLSRQERALSTSEAFACTLASARSWALLSGEGPLRRVAEGRKIKVRTLLCIVDLLEQSGYSSSALRTGLTVIAGKCRCQMLRAQVSQRLRRHDRN
jgi:hypothetical protein